MIRTTSSRPRCWNARPMPPNAPLHKICCACRKPAGPGYSDRPLSSPGEPLQSALSARQRSRRSGVATATTKPAQSAQCRPTVEQSGPLGLARQHPLPAAAENPNTSGTGTPGKSGHSEDLGSRRSAAAPGSRTRPVRVPVLDLLNDESDRLQLLLLRRRPDSKEQRFSWGWYAPS